MMYDHKNKGGSCQKPDCWCRGYQNTAQTPEGQMDAYRNETPEERAARELKQAEGLRNMYEPSMFKPVPDEQRQEWDSPFKAAYMLDEYGQYRDPYPEERDGVYDEYYEYERRKKKVESRLPLAIAWTAILVIIVLGVLGLILP